MLDLNGKKLKITVYIEEVQGEAKTQAKATEGADFSTTAQQQAIYSIATSLGWKDYEIKAHLDKTYQVESSKQLTKKQASEVIDYLKKGQ